MSRADDERVRGGKPRELVLLLLWLWVLVVALYFCWEVATYRGLYAILSEWQFDRIGQNLPTLNFVALALLFTWPVLILAGILNLRRAPHENDNLPADASPEHRAEARAAVHRESEQEAGRAIFAAQGYMHLLFGFAAALALAAVASLLWTLALPKETGPLETLDPQAGYNATPPQGPTLLQGDLTYGRIASFSRGILFFRRTALYAPIIPPQGVAKQDVRYFVEFLPSERADLQAGGKLSHRAGILVRGDLPGALVRLYRYLGYFPARTYYVLYASADTMRWPYLILSVQFAVGALVFLALAGWQRRHIRFVHRRVMAERQRFLRREARIAAREQG